MLLIYMVTQKCQPLPIDENKFERIVCLGDMLNTPNDSDIGYFLEFGLRYSYKTKNKTIPLCTLKIKLYLKMIPMKM